MKNRIYIVGMGPGKEEMMTAQAIRALEESDVIIGYPVYLNLLGERFSGKEFLSTAAVRCVLRKPKKEKRSLWYAVEMRGSMEWLPCFLNWAKKSRRQSLW